MSTKVLIAASGTGGHLFPALYLARALQAKEPGIEVHFLGTGRPLEEKIIGATEFTRHTIKMVGLNRRGVKGLLEFLTVLPSAIKNTKALLTDLKPSAVVGVGGYASVLPILIARWMGIPTWIHEAEVSPGLANSLLSFFTTKASVAFRETKMARPKRVVWTGHPVRPEVYRVPQKINVGEAITNLLILGGSQGAEGLDRAVNELIPLLRARKITVWHQCRAVNLEMLTALYKTENIPATVCSFIDNLEEAYTWAHLIVSRSGAGTVSELAVVNRPAILVPFPSKAIKQHENADVLGNQGKAIVVEEGENFVGRLTSALNTLLDESHFRAMEDRAREVPSADAAGQIAEGIVALWKAL